MIREIFEIDENNSLDKAEALGSDRVGYRSFHFVCSLGGRRNSLPEYGSLCGLKFEIQVRTVLQHGWAEITHDRSYKFGQALPGEIQHKLNLYAGTLEIVDAGFDEVARDIDTYAAALRKAAPTQLLQEPINSISVNLLIEEVGNRYKLALRPLNDERSDDLITELQRLSYSTLGDIWSFITEDFVNDFKEAGISESGAAFLRSVLIITDAEKYFAESGFKWTAIQEEALPLFVRMWGEAKVHELLEKHNLTTYRGARTPKLRS